MRPICVGRHGVEARVITRSRSWILFRLVCPGAVAADGFLPPDDLSQTQVYLSLPPGSTFKETLAAAERARESCNSIRT